jgi:arabinofuranosyltransferase
MTSQTRQQSVISIDISLPLIIFLRVGSVLLYSWYVIQRAWLGDDVFITLRTVANFVNGYGLVFNLGERVQSYTHPLWMFVLSTAYFFTHEAYFTTIFISIAISILTVILLQSRVSTNIWSGSFAIIILSLSSAYLDYSTSGLENPLSHLLLVILAIVYFTDDGKKHKLFWMSFISSLAFLNRQDVLLLYLPILLYSYFSRPSIQGLKKILLGMLPAVAWEIFSVVYYGFPFPNTAYAKLNSIIPKLDLWRQGVNYFIHTWKYDPYTLVMLIVGGVLTATQPAKSRERVWIIGAILYCIYLISIGGDFMGGRFLCLPLLSIAILLSRRPSKPVAIKIRTALLIAMILLSAGASSRPWSGKEFSNLPTIDDNGVADERNFYFWGNGLLAQPEWKDLPRFNWKQDGIDFARADTKVVFMALSGLTSYYAGPEVDFIDGYALSDAFLARIPYEPGGSWRIGHFFRVPSQEYIRLKSGFSDELPDEAQQLLYDRINLVISGPIWSPERWQAIWELNSPAWLQ